MDLARHSLPLGKRPALILVDMIKGFTDPSCALGSACQPVIDANIRLLQAFRARGLPVVFTTVVYQAAAEGAVFRARVPALNLLTPDSPWVQVDEQLQMQQDELLIEKHGASAFFNTDLAQQLRQRGVDSVVVTGLTTSGCVRATVVDAMQHNFPVQLPAEAVGDRNPAAHQANLFDLHAKYADVVSLEQLLSELNQLAN